MGSGAKRRLRAPPLTCCWLATAPVHASQYVAPPQVCAGNANKPDSFSAHSLAKIELLSSSVLRDCCTAIILLPNRAHATKANVLYCRMISVVARVLYALLRALMLIARLRPHVVIGTGGYVSFPTCLAAWILRCPVLLQEQNAVPGLANRVLSLLASCVCVAFPECLNRLLIRCPHDAEQGPLHAYSGVPLL